MSEQKTLPTGRDVGNFIREFANTEQKIADSFELLALMKSISGEEPHMWGPSIIGFGKYAYTYASGHSGEAPLIGFSPRKAAISLYVFTGLPDHEPLLKNLGKFKMGKACLYINKLSDIDKEALIPLMKATIQYLETTHKRL